MLLAVRRGTIKSTPKIPPQSAINAIDTKDGAVTPLPFPEGKACAEVLLAGEEGGSKSKVVFAGLGIAAVYKFIADGLKLFPSEVEFSMQGQYTTSVGMDVLPAPIYLT